MKFTFSLLIALISMFHFLEFLFRIWCQNKSSILLRDFMTGYVENEKRDGRQSTLPDRFTSKERFEDHWRDIGEFLKAIAVRPADQVWEERLLGYQVQIDGNLAHVWTLMILAQWWFQSLWSQCLYLGQNRSRVENRTFDWFPEEGRCLD